MRNLKRVVCLALASVMLLGMMVMGAGAADTKKPLTDLDVIENKDAVNLMVDLGVITGKPDGSYAPTETVDRATMSTLIYKIMTGEANADAYKGAASLADAKGHWAEGFINYCSSLKIVTGDNTNFYPASKVTVAAAAKMLLVSIGYDAELSKYQNDPMWSVNVMKDAKKAGIVTGVDQLPTDELTRDNAALMVRNTIFATPVEAEIDRDMGVAYLKGYKPSEIAKPFAEDVFDLVEVKAQFLGTKTAPFAATSDLEDGQVAVAVKDGDDYEVTETVLTISAPNSLLGYEVKYYNNSKGDLVSSSLVSTDATKVTTVTKDYAKAEAKMDLTAAEYSNGYAALADDEIARDAGTVLYINTDGDKNNTIEFVVITTSTFAKVTNVNTARGTITIEGLGTRNIKDVDGAADLAKDDYILYVTTGNTVVVEKAPSITGIVTAKKGAEGSMKATIGGKSYDVVAGSPAEEYISALTIKDAKEGTFYLNKAGAIVVFEGEESAAESKYAIVTALKVTADEWDANKKAVEGKLILADGTQVTGKIVDVKGDTANDSVYDAAVEAASFTNIVGKVYEYSTNTDGDYIMKATYVPDTDTATGATTTKTSIAYKTGAPKIASDVFVNANTTVLYYDVVNNKVVTSSYTGISTLPNMAAGVSMEVVMQAEPNNTFASFIYVGAVAAKAQSDAQYAYFFTDEYATTADGKEYQVVVDGDIAKLVLDEDADEPVANTVYTYTTDADGISTLSEDPATLVEDKLVSTVFEDSLIITDLAGANPDSIALGDYTVDDLTYFVKDVVDPAVGAFAKGDRIVYITENIAGTTTIVKAYIVPNPAIESANITGTLKLTANAVGATGGDVSYQWFKDNAEVADATEKAFTPTESGNYKVTITVTSKLDDTVIATATSDVKNVTVPSP